MWFTSNKYQVLFVIVLTAALDIARCDANSNTNFNSHLRDYSANDISNITNINTLQKEDLRTYATYTPASNPIKLKEISDSALSSSSNGRTMLYHDQTGYGVNVYEEGLHNAHGHDYHLYDSHPNVHGPPTFEHDHPNSYPHSDHHNYHDPHGHRDYIPSHDHGHHYSGHGHHHSEHGLYNKHYKHALAAKSAVLWPIAGIALLGAAAALVSNPILLQLGVVSGKRRRRDTEEVTRPDFPSDSIIKYMDTIKDQRNENKIVQLKEDVRKRTKQNGILKIASLTKTAQRRVLKTNTLKDGQSNDNIRKKRSSVKRNVNQVTTSPVKYNSNNDDDRFIPIPIKLITPKVAN